MGALGECYFSGGLGESNGAKARWLLMVFRDSVPDPARALPVDPRRALGPFETLFAILVEWFFWGICAC